MFDINVHLKDGIVIKFIACRRLCHVLQQQSRRHSSIYCCDASVRCATQDHADHGGVERCNQRWSWEADQRFL